VSPVSARARPDTEGHRSKEVKAPCASVSRGAVRHGASQLQGGLHCACAQYTHPRTRPSPRASLSCPDQPRDECQALGGTPWRSLAAPLGPPFSAGAQRLAATSPSTLRFATGLVPRLPLMRLRSRTLFRNVGSFISPPALAPSSDRPFPELFFHASDQLPDCLLFCGRQGVTSIPSATWPLAAAATRCRWANRSPPAHGQVAGGDGSFRSLRSRLVKCSLPGGERLGPKGSGFLWKGSGIANSGKTPYRWKYG
jgi:hypothetical protein